jgi:hypothetical protein
MSKGLPITHDSGFGAMVLPPIASLSVDAEPPLEAVFPAAFPSIGSST